MFLVIPNISNFPNFPLGVIFLIIPNIPNCLTFPQEVIFLIIPIFCLMLLILGIWHLPRSGPEGAGAGRWQMWLGSAGCTGWDYF